MRGARDLVHGTAVAVDGHGVLMLGRSGSGKSDLALRLIDRGAVLISDDAVVVDLADERPVLRAAPNIESRLEIRGVGICTVASTDSAPLRLLVDLENEPERLPSELAKRALLGFDVPFANIAPFEASAAIKLEHALRRIVDAHRWPMAKGATTAAESKTA